MLSLLVCTGAIVMPANPPFILRLHNPSKGMYPIIAESIAQWSQIKLAIHQQKKPYRSTVTTSGHVLAMNPLDGDDSPAIDCLKTHTNLIDHIPRLVDYVHVAEDNTPCFKCFFTSAESPKAIAARLDGTNIWLLISDYGGILSCDECKTNIDRTEFTQIQNGFMNLLSNKTEGGYVGKIVPVPKDFRK